MYRCWPEPDQRRPALRQQTASRTARWMTASTWGTTFPLNTGTPNSSRIISSRCQFERRSARNAGNIRAVRNPGPTWPPSGGVARPGDERTYRRCGSLRQRRAIRLSGRVGDCGGRRRFAPGYIGARDAEQASRVPNIPAMDQGHRGWAHSLSAAASVNALRPSASEMRGRQTLQRKAHRRRANWPSANRRHDEMGARANPHQTTTELYKQALDSGQKRPCDGKKVHRNGTCH